MRDIYVEPGNPAGQESPAATAAYGEVIIACAGGAEATTLGGGMGDPDGDENSHG